MNYTNKIALEELAYNRGYFVDALQNEAIESKLIYSPEADCWSTGRLESSSSTTLGALAVQKGVLLPHAAQMSIQNHRLINRFRAALINQFVKSCGGGIIANR